jgi:hypothetical protein
MQALGESPCPRRGANVVAGQRDRAERWRTNPMIIAHTLIHAVASIGYTLLATHVSWLP